MPDDASHDDALEDAALARRIMAGEREAEAALYRRLLPRIRAWGLKHLRGDEAAALDLAQHVLLGVFDALRARRVENVDRVGAFVIGVCKHTLASWRRGERRRAELLERFGTVLAPVPPAPAPTLDRDALARCFEQLAARARAVIALTFYAERSSDEIAAELGVSVANVRVVRHRALAQLHACMEGA